MGRPKSSVKNIARAPIPSGRPIGTITREMLKPSDAGSRRQPTTPASTITNTWPPAVGQANTASAGQNGDRGALAVRAQRSRHAPDRLSHHGNGRDL